jgi:hypothetical protein
MDGGPHCELREDATFHLLVLVQPVRSHEQRRLALPLPGIERTGGVGRGTTKEQRRLQLMAAFGSVVDAACCTIGKTKDLLQILTDHMNTLTIRDVSLLPQVAEPPTLMSTIVTAATAAAPAVTQEDEDEDISIAHLGAANPRTVKHQRHQRPQVWPQLVAERVALTLMLSAERFKYTVNSCRLKFHGSPYILVKLQRATAMVNSQNRLFGTGAGPRQDQGHQ